MEFPSFKMLRQTGTGTSPLRCSSPAPYCPPQVSATARHSQQKAVWTQLPLSARKPWALFFQNSEITSPCQAYACVEVVHGYGYYCLLFKRLPKWFRCSTGYRARWYRPHFVCRLRRRWNVFLHETVAYPHESRIHELSLKVWHRHYFVGQALSKVMSSNIMRMKTFFKHENHILQLTPCIISSCFEKHSSNHLRWVNDNEHIQ